MTEDTLSEDVVVMLEEALTHRKAHKLANAVFSLGNVMACIKSLIAAHERPPTSFLVSNC